MLQNALRDAEFQVLRAGKHTFIGPSTIVRESALKPSTLINARKSPFPGEVLPRGSINFPGPPVGNVMAVLGELVERRALESAQYPTNNVFLYCAEAVTQREAAEIIEAALSLQGAEPVLFGDSFITVRPIHDASIETRPIRRNALPAR